FAEPNPLFYEYSAWGPRTIQARLGVLSALANAPAGGPPTVIVPSARALMARTLPQHEFLKNTQTLRAGQPVRLERTLEAWVGAGYIPTTIVVVSGQFAPRGWTTCPAARRCWWTTGASWRTPWRSLRHRRWN